MSRAQNFLRFFKPRTVAFVGGRSAQQYLRRCREFGFGGKLYYVNPRLDGAPPAGLEGVTCVPTLADLPSPPDATFLAVSAELTLGYVSELAAMGAGGVVCYAAGFGEVGDEGRLRQQALIDAAGDSLAVLGPNCYGFINAVDQVALWVGNPALKPVPKGVAIISQSGALVETITMGSRSLPTAYAISAGNQAVLAVEDLIEGFLHMAEVTAIALYIETLNDVDRFSRAALRALEQNVPIIAIKSGTSAVGKTIAIGHTGSLGGADKLYDALFERLCVVRASSVTELVETAKMLSIAGAPDGPRMAASAASGGDMAMIADAGENLGLEFPPLNDSQYDTIRALLPDFATVSNPLDYTLGGWGRPEVQRIMCEELAGGNVDIMAHITEYPSSIEDGSGPDPAYGECDYVIDALIAARHSSHKAVVGITQMPENMPDYARERLVANGVAPLLGLRDAMQAIAHGVWYGRQRQYILSQPAESRLLSGVSEPKADHTTLSEWQAKQTLAGLGIKLPSGTLATLETVARAADDIGYPVVIKAAGAVIAHKTEAGAVAVGLTSRDEVQQAAEGMARRLPEASNSFLVEAMVAGPVAALIVAIGRDAQFGAYLTIGSGGVLVELLQDSATLLLPVTRDDIARAIAKLRVATLLEGHRGGPPGDVEALTETMFALAQYAGNQGAALGELEINPLFVMASGGGVYAIDALIVAAE
ncbi:MAG: acetate--CoA ligase family protein [Alphaproteobacteria bacterium]